MLTSKQLEVISAYERELRSTYERITAALSEYGHVEAEPQEARGPEYSEDPDTGDILIDMVPGLLKQRSAVSASLKNQATLVESYVRELLQYERFCVDTLANPEYSNEHLKRHLELEQLRIDLPSWKDALYLLTVKRIGQPNTEETLRDLEGRDTWIIRYDKNGNEEWSMHFDYEDDSDLQIDEDFESNK